MNRTTRYLVVLVLSLSPLTVPRAADAQEVQAELTLGVLSVGSVGAQVDAGAGGGGSAIGVVDFSDTSLLVRGRLQLYDELRGGSVIGLQFPDADSDLGVVFFHNAFVFLQGRNIDVRVGRARVQSSIVEFPTVRDDDLLPYSDTLNPFSTGETTEDHQYGNVLEVTGNLDAKYFLSLHAEHMFTTPGDTRSFDFSLNSFGGSALYRNIPARINTEVLRELGVGVNYYDARDDGLEPEWSAIFGGAINLYPDPVHLVDFRAQGIYKTGNADASLTDPASTLRVPAVTAAASLRYLYSKAGLPRFQTALVGGYARYLQDAGDAQSWSAILNGFYSLGAGFAVGLQYQVAFASSELRSALDVPELRHSVQAVLRFEYELIANPLPYRDSILNVEHGYIP